MRDNYNENAQSSFAKAYLAALQAVIRFDEGLAGARLNKVRDIMLSTVSPNQVGEITEEKGIYIELKNNRIMERGVLYGDLTSESKTPWIKDAGIVAMIARHIRLLGNEEDKAQLNVFLEKTEKSFGSKPTAATIPAGPVLVRA